MPYLITILNDSNNPQDLLGFCYLRYYTKPVHKSKTMVVIHVLVSFGVRAVIPFLSAASIYSSTTYQVWFGHSSQDSGHLSHFRHSGTRFIWTRVRSISLALETYPFVDQSVKTMILCLNSWSKWTFLMRNLQNLTPSEFRTSNST